ncbi:trans-resveratrol di-O-methyltransferase-like isoform X2 [Asparagus officinalis]|uniref:trans-resveratrol di-O-methyltransferase-like isoform X2 n=1 Tax=Asparagus officinalis TaxID=4686 RepID=UPI00098E67EF|nr:trans-resveratrol di-O-methyltransferase-like isoform X2 [Asparagus officinalis]
MASTEGVNSKELLEAQSHLWNHIFGFINSFSLKSALELGIPEAVHKHGRPITLPELTAALSIPSSRIPCFQRFMQLLVHSGLFSSSQNAQGDTYSPTTFSSLLLSEKSGCMTPFIYAMLDEAILSPWQFLSTWMKEEEPPTVFEKAHGMNLWQAIEKMPWFGKMLRGAMESDSGLITKVVVDEFGVQLFGDVKSVVEVAAGSVMISRAVAQAFPEVKVTILDLPHVIEVMDKSEGRIQYVAGDMFEYIPPADALLLKRCKEATPPKEEGGKVIIIDKVLKNEGLHHKLTETQLHFDLHMMIHTPGKQRNEEEWKRLFFDAGFKEYKITPALGLRAIIEVYH